LQSGLAIVNANHYHSYQSNYQGDPIVLRSLLLAALLLLGSTSVMAADDEFRLVIENHKFTPEELTVPAGKKIKLVVENRDATPEEFESHSLNREKVIAGKSTATIFIGPLKAGKYPFVGEYNEATAKGVIVAK
jgi:plastocyanin